MKLRCSLKKCRAEPCLMVLCLVLLIYALRCPTGRNVAYSSQENIHICSFQPDECPLFPSDLPTYLRVYRTVDERRLIELERSFVVHLNRSGFSYYTPSGCRSPFKVAIIVPYRNRLEHLELFLQHMHRFLPLQNIEYAIYVVEQSEKHLFNRAKLFNIGYKEALRDKDYCCFIFHDIDLLPENPHNLYVCSDQPRHMCVAIDTMRYVLPYAGIFGGVVAIRKEQFEAVNGFSNRFYGWGGEDDDLALRIKLNGLDITRWDGDIARYSMMMHTKARPNPQRYDLLAKSSKVIAEDGLTDLKYNVLSVHRNPLYSKIIVDVNP